MYEKKYAMPIAPFPPTGPQQNRPSYSPHPPDERHSRSLDFHSLKHLSSGKASRQDGTRS